MPPAPEQLSPLGAKTTRWALGYPFAGVFGQTLETLRKTLVDKLAGRKKSPGQKKKPSLYHGHISTHGALQAIQADLSSWDAVVLPYLSVRQKGSLSVEPFQGAAPFLSFSRVGFEPSFSSVARGRLFKTWAKDVEKAEEVLTGRLLEVPPGGADAFRVREVLAWTRVVRLCIACALVEALDYQAVWDALDGDAGWWLSGEVKGLVDGLISLPLFQEMERLREDRTGFLDELGLLRELPSADSLKALVPIAQAWRDGASGPASVKDLGVKHPWTFRRMGPDLALSAGPQFFARAAAEERTRLLKRLWEDRRAELLRRGVITRAKDFAFVLTAGTLAHGGKHPPHQTHRNGASMDLDLTGLPSLAKEFSAASLPIGAAADAPENPDDDIPEPDGAGLSPDDVPSTDRSQEWNFPSDPREKEFRAAAVAFTECVYLTFPLSILYASALVVQSAKAALLDRLDALESRAEVDDQARRDLLGEIRKRVRAVVPDPYRGSSEEAETDVRRAHRDHWHVSYDPDRLGDDGAAVSDDPEEARKAAAVLAEMAAQDIPAELFALSLETVTPP